MVSGPRLRTAQGLFVCCHGDGEVEAALRDLQSPGLPFRLQFPFLVPSAWLGHCRKPCSDSRAESTFVFARGFCIHIPFVFWPWPFHKLPGPPSPPLRQTLV